MSGSRVTFSVDGQSWVVISFLPFRQLWHLTLLRPLVHCRWQRSDDRRNYETHRSQDGFPRERTPETCQKKPSVLVIPYHSLLISRTTETCLNWVGNFENERRQVGTGLELFSCQTTTDSRVSCPERSVNLDVKLESKFRVSSILEGWKDVETL